MGTLTACDVVEGPKVDPNGFTGSTNKVLVEDFTGQRCGNCPRAHEVAHNLKETYGDNVVIIAVHAGSFAQPVPVIGYPADYRTEMGTELEAYYQCYALTGLPIGVIGRRSWNGSPLINHTNWSTAVGTALAEEPKMKIDAVPAFNSTDHTLNLSVKLEYFTTGDANHNIVALITEDSIISKQEDYSLASQHVDEYVHMHMLRAPITPGGTWGTPVKGNDIVLGEKFDFNFTTTLDTAWVPEHCHVVVYVHNNLTKEIVQVQEVSLAD